MQPVPLLHKIPRMEECELFLLSCKNKGDDEAFNYILKYDVQHETDNAVQPFLHRTPLLSHTVDTTNNASVLVSKSKLKNFDHEQDHRDEQVGTQRKHPNLTCR